MALAVVACSHLPQYSHYEHLGNDGWQRDDTVVFSTVVNDGGCYRLLLGLRATNAYPYTQLMLTAHCSSAVSGVDLVDTVRLQVTDDKGNILGYGTGFFQYEHPLSEVHLSNQDTLTVCVTHVMSRFLLPGITDIGLTVE